MNIRHFGMTVKDLRKTETTFVALGFAVISRGRENKEFMKKLCGEECTCTWVKLEDEDGTVIEFAKYNPDIGVKFHMSVSVKKIEDYNVKEFATNHNKRKIKYQPYEGIMLELVQ